MEDNNKMGVESEEGQPVTGTRPGTEVIPPEGTGQGNLPATPDGQSEENVSQVGEQTGNTQQGGRPPREPMGGGREPGGTGTSDIGSSTAIPGATGNIEGTPGNTQTNQQTGQGGDRRPGAGGVGGKNVGNVEEETHTSKDRESLEIFTG